MIDTVRSNPPESRKKLQLARAATIEAYSDLEHQLSLQFADLMGSSYDKSAFVFYRITNSFSRNRILQGLLKREYGTRYNKFWNSLIKLIRQLDEERNKIVHWHIYQTEADDEQPSEDVLAPHIGDGSDETIVADDLWEFVNKTEYIRLQATMFYIFHLARPSPEDQQQNTSYEIFQRPCLYPPPKDNPGFHSSPKPETPPRSSGE